MNRSNPMSLFGQHARGIEAQSVRGLDPGVISPGFARGIGCASCAQPPCMQPAGLGDWFSDAIDSLHRGGVSVIGAVTGSTAAAEAQRNAVAIAQAQAAADMESSRAFSAAIPWVAGAIVAVGVAIVVLKK